MNTLNKALTYKVYPLEKNKEKKKCKKWSIQVNLPPSSKNGKIIYPKKRKTFTGQYRQAEEVAKAFQVELE